MVPGASFAPRAELERVVDHPEGVGRVGRDEGGEGVCEAGELEQSLLGFGEQWGRERVGWAKAGESEMLG